MFDRIIRLRDCPIAQYPFIWYTREVGYTPSDLRNKLGTFSGMSPTWMSEPTASKPTPKSHLAMSFTRDVYLICVLIEL